jgi:hypothetical protein
VPAASSAAAAAALIAPSKAHFLKMQDECDLQTNIPKESARQKV